jgi:Holliday junction resolvase RusA-like endonuclease
VNTPTPIQFFAIGEPKGQPRARAFARVVNGKPFVRMYDPASAEGWKSQIADAARPYAPFLPMTGPVRMDGVFVFPRPKSHYGSGKNADKLKEGAPRFHTSKPDGDNLCKAVWDCLTTLGFWRDDCQICAGEWTKVYVGFGLFTKPGCHITITPLESQAEAVVQRRLALA